MKKLTIFRRLWLEHRRLSSAASRTRERSKAARKRRKQKSIRIVIDTKEGQVVGWAETRKPMPSALCLERNPDACLDRIGELRHTLSKRIRIHALGGQPKAEKRGHFPSFLDFATIEECSPATALVVAAEYDRARTFVPFDLQLIDLGKWKPEIVRLFDQIGFFKLLGIRRPRIGKAVPGPLTVVPFKTGETVGNRAAGEMIRTLAEMVLGADPHGLDDERTKSARTHLFAALVEATENTRKHAYPSGFDLGSGAVNRWWMTGSFDASEKRITLVVFDQGITIPASLPHWDKFGKVERAYARLIGAPAPHPADTSRDGLLLHMAMSMPRSSTGLDYRGKGFPAFKEVINACRKGRLRILSRCGEFTLEKGRRPNARQLRKPLNGTLVEWDLWL